jgi:hypothetical protein
MDHPSVEISVLRVSYYWLGRLNPDKLPFNGLWCCQPRVELAAAIVYRDTTERFHYTARPTVLRVL